MQTRDNSVNYRIVAERLERAAQMLRDDPYNGERAERLAKLAEQIRDDLAASERQRGMHQSLPPGFMNDDEND